MVKRRSQRGRLGPGISKPSTEFGFYSKYVRELLELRGKITLSALENGEGVSELWAAVTQGKSDGRGARKTPYMN